MICPQLAVLGLAWCWVSILCVLALGTEVNVHGLVYL